MLGNLHSAENSRLGRFLLLELLGVGGFATVYRAEDTELDRQVAIKLLHPHLSIDQVFVRRFRSEARAAARLREQHIVTIYDVGATDDGRTYLVMELLSGATLAKLIAGNAPFSLPRVAGIVSQLGSALDYVHGQGLVHRDLKPANVMIMDEDAVKLMDFGIARSLNDHAHLTATGQAVGSPHYMSPEQIVSEQVGPATDIYALGILAYELFARRPPFLGSPSAIMDQHRFAPPPALRQFNPNVPAAAAEAVERALAKDARQRPTTASAFAAMLAESLPTARVLARATRPAAWDPPRPAATGFDPAGSPLKPELAGGGSMPVRRWRFRLSHIVPRGLATRFASRQATRRVAAQGAAEPGAAQALTVPMARADLVPGRHLMLPVAVGALLLVTLLALAYLRSSGRIGDSKSAGVAPSPASVAPSPVSSLSPTPPKLAVRGLKICNDPSDCRQTDFVAGEDVNACFAIAPSDDGRPLVAVTTGERPDPPPSAADGSVVARSDAIPQSAGDGCYPMKVLSGLLQEGMYTVWVLHGTDLLARAGFHAAAPPAPTPEPTPEPIPTPAPVRAPQPAVSQPQPTQRPVQPVQPVQQPVRTSAPAPAPVQPPPAAPQQPVPPQQQPVPPQ